MVSSSVYVLISSTMQSVFPQPTRYHGTTMSWMCNAVKWCVILEFLVHIAMVVTLEAMQATSLAYANDCRLSVT